MAFSYEDAAGHVEKGKIRPVYLIFGEEDYLQEKLVEKIKAAWLTDVLPEFNDSREDGAKMTGAQAADLANQLPFMAPRRLVLIENPGFIPCTSGKPDKASREDAESSEGADGEEGTEAAAEEGLAAGKTVKSVKGAKTAGQEFLEYLTAPAESTCLILWCRKGKPDRRNKLVSTLEKQGGLVEVPALKTQEALRELRRLAAASGKRFGPGALEHLANYSRPSLRIIAGELEKIITYGGDASSIDLRMVQDVMTPSLEADIFSLVDALAQKKSTQAIHQLRSLLTRGEPPLRILFMMVRQFRLIFRAKIYLQKGHHRKQLSSDLDCSPFVAEKAASQSANFNFEDLERIHHWLLEKDFQLKNGANPRYALEELIMMIAEM